MYIHVHLSNTQQQPSFKLIFSSCNNALLTCSFLSFFFSHFINKQFYIRPHYGIIVVSVYRHVRFCWYFFFCHWSGLTIVCFLYRLPIRKCRSVGNIRYVAVPAARIAFEIENESSFHYQAWRQWLRAHRYGQQKINTVVALKIEKIFNLDAERWTTCTK